ncbi:MAG TPA: FAD-binding oxidoreductase [Acidimicrobiales bacterium]|nr:FAD-binding oxidoreductase [Acidimicrobiales bacterium]
MTRPVMPNEYPAVTLNRAPEPDDDLARELRAAGVTIDTAASARADHGRDWWPLSIAQVHAGRVPHWPGLVARPTTSGQVAEVLRRAGARGVAVTAQGGRSGVVGGAVAPDGGVALDMTGLNRVLEIDDVSGLVRVEAGCFGPELEAATRARGWTVGHHPQSFELSTVGGWIACRGAGQYSNRYGKVEDIVRALSVVLASGEMIHLGGRAPRRATGPDLLQLFVGSEGALGVITEATLVMRPAPAHEARAAYGFATFEAGLETCRRIVQRGAAPAVLRLYDETESRRHFQVQGCALIVLDEGDESLCDAAMSVVAVECALATELETELVTTWIAHRNDVDALAPLWEAGVVVDTVEVSGAWSDLAAMSQRVLTTLRALPDTRAASVHQSHAYLDGACLYFTFAGRPEGDPTGYYRSAWDAVSREVLSAGGALSHHHGVGRNRARFMSAALGDTFALLSSLKALLDPGNILNPGVLGLGGPSW